MLYFELLEQSGPENHHANNTENKETVTESQVREARKKCFAFIKSTQVDGFGAYNNVFIRGDDTVTISALLSPKENLALNGVTIVRLNGKTGESQTETRFEIDGRFPEYTLTKKSKEGEETETIPKLVIKSRNSRKAFYDKATEYFSNK